MVKEVVESRIASGYLSQLPESLTDVRGVGASMMRANTSCIPSQTDPKVKRNEENERKLPLLTISWK